jgi:hypothetical protein
MPNDAVFYSKKLEILDYALLDHAHLAALSLSSLTLVNHLTFLPLSTIQMQNLTRIFPAPSFSLEHLPLSLSIDLQSLLDIKEAGFIGRFERPEACTVQGQVYLRGGFCVGKGA